MATKLNPNLWGPKVIINNKVIKRKTKLKTNINI